MGSFTELEAAGQKEEGWDAEREIQSERGVQIP